MRVARTGHARRRTYPPSETETDSMDTEPIDVDEEAELILPLDGPHTSGATR